MVPYGRSTSHPACHAVNLNPAKPLPQTNNPIPPAQLDLAPTATKLTGQLPPPPEKLYADGPPSSGQPGGGLRRFRWGLFPVYPLPTIRQLLQCLEVRLALVNYVHRDRHGLAVAAIQ